MNEFLATVGIIGLCISTGTAIMLGLVDIILKLGEKDATKENQ